MSLTYKLDLNWVNMNQIADYLGQKPFYSKVIVPTHTDTQKTDGTRRTTQVKRSVDIKYVLF